VAIQGSPRRCTPRDDSLVLTDNGLEFWDKYDILFAWRMVFMDENELKEILLKKNKDFKDLFSLHQQYERDLQTFKNKPVLTEEERVKEKELKKKKLALKDRMYFMMTEYKKKT
jgi:uncharacterized protein YdcH (DUF465 family)